MVALGRTREKGVRVRESLAQVRETIHNEGPDGILGFSQGASLTALAHASLHDDVRFVCLVGGFIPRNEEQVSFERRRAI